MLKHTISGGRRNGFVTAVTHGLGVGFYAFICVLGLAAVITASATAFFVLQAAGAIYLGWLGVKSLRATPREWTADEASSKPLSAPARDGFLVVFLNPKIAVFFLALFSQVVGDASFIAKLGYAFTAMTIDMVWYLLVAGFVSKPLWLQRIQQHEVWVERILGIILMVVALRLFYGLFS